MSLYGGKGAIKRHNKNCGSDQFKNIYIHLNTYVHTLEREGDRERFGGERERGKEGKRERGKEGERASAICM